MVELQKNSKILVVGLGYRTGVSVCNFLARSGHRVFASDKKGRDELEEIIATLSTLKEVYKSKIALLVEGKIQMFIAKLACLLSKRSGFNIEPFTEIEQAESYLGVVKD